MERKEATSHVSDSIASVADLEHQLVELQAAFMDAIEEKTRLEAEVAAYEVKLK